MQNLYSDRKKENKVSLDQGRGREKSCEYKMSSMEINTLRLLGSKLQCPWAFSPMNTSSSLAHAHVGGDTR